MNEKKLLAQPHRSKRSDRDLLECRVVERALASHLVAEHFTNIGAHEWHQGTGGFGDHNDASKEENDAHKRLRHQH